MSLSLVKGAIRPALPLSLLYEKPYTQVPFLINQSHITQVMTTFFEFLKLPEEIKNHIDFKISPLHRRGDIGFKHRDPDNDIYNDSKDFFHFHPLIFEKYKEFIPDNPLIDQFLKLALPLWEATYNIVYEIISIFEQDYPGTLSKVFATNEPHIILRFLKYNWGESGKHLAKPHFDSGSFTLAIAESGPGLRIGTNPNDLEIITHEANKAIFMASSNFRKIIDTDSLCPGWHDVIQLDEKKIGKSFSRWAIVAFIDGHNVESLSRSETHKWYLPEHS
ncbi:hypothetical protein [Candidatus Odyssella acanthamoebae]|uniref:Fe2OG dioxygenase domain-containing protein n=1 Tax=Candidatus Odyssella acanthamoebae TaxID=91604 RepID=A0A077AZ16_9PROT|nr:hypothetical protein [Candidatus Paracaedibacter acanthamoebae]AIK96878.1 hypothetical protein ID47_09230 [Candidatus Paracaedibacter acanthamoebae]